MIATRSQGGILLVSSTAAFQGVPFIANYSAANGYVLNLGESLNNELKQSGIHISILVPRPTEIEMMETSGGKFDQFPTPLMAAEDVARSGLNALLKSKPYTVPSRLNRYMSSFMGR